MKIQFDSNQDYQLDATFDNDNQLKTNAVPEMKSHAVEFRTV